MAKPTVRIPKNLLAAVDAAASERGVQPSTLVQQAVRFYLAATDPRLVANAVAEALKPVAADIRHIKYQVDKRGTDPASAGAVAGPQQGDYIRQLVEEKARHIRDRLTSSSPQPTRAGNDSGGSR